MAMLDIVQIEDANPMPAANLEITIETGASQLLK
jgi:hypothetical protein